MNSHTAADRRRHQTPGRLARLELYRYAVDAAHRALHPEFANVDGLCTSSDARAAAKAVLHSIGIEVD
jgi:hypothetical protein